MHAHLDDKVYKLVVGDGFCANCCRLFSNQQQSWNA
jgi:hypothetical protein